MNPTDFHPDHLSDLRKSGLSDETIEMMDVYSARPADIPKLVGWNPEEVGSALVFPYHGVNGYCRLKVFPAFKDAADHTVKYLQPKATNPHLYILPLVRRNLEDFVMPLLITEGEKKAAKAVQERLLCIGLGGLWSWFEKGVPIKELDEIAFADRTVYFVPDSDVWARRDLMKAVYAFCDELEERGAHTAVVMIPPQGDEKVGLDDFLVNHSKDDFFELKKLALKDKAFNHCKDWHKNWKQERQKKFGRGNPRGKASNGAEMSQTEREEAIALLMRKDLLLQFLRDVEKLGCAGEEDNKAILYLSYTSRKLTQPINITVKGESAAGKNFLVASVGKFFPPEELHFISCATPKAFFYMPEDLSHKVVVIAEESGSQEADYSIRSFQSEGEISILVPEKDKTTGRIETRERKVKGPVAFIQTTTKAHLHQENETRNFDLFIDESEAQTKAIFTTHNRKYLGSDGPEEESFLKAWRNAQKLLEPNPILIPYVEAIEFPTMPLRVRRDRPRFLALIEASTLLHQHQRERREIQKHKYVVATLDDYEIARDLGIKILGWVLKGITPKCEELVNKAGGFEGEFTRTETEKELGWDRKTVSKYLREAVGLGCLDEVEKNKGCPTKYRFVKTLEEVGCSLLTRQQLEEKLSKFTKVGDMSFGPVN